MADLSCVGQTFGHAYSPLLLLGSAAEWLQEQANLPQSRHSSLQQ
jgi:hypothetical protein